MSRRTFRIPLFAELWACAPCGCHLPNWSPPPPKVAKKDPPPKPRFDEAKRAHLTGVVENDGEKELWIHIQTSGKILKLSKGDEIKIGTVEGTLTEIQLKWVKIETPDGPIIVKAGKMLDSGKSPDDRTASR